MLGDTLSSDSIVVDELIENVHNPLPWKTSKIWGWLYPELPSNLKEVVRITSRGIDFLYLDVKGKIIWGVYVEFWKKNIIKKCSSVYTKFLEFVSNFYHTFRIKYGIIFFFFFLNMLEISAQMFLRENVMQPKWVPPPIILQLSSSYELYVITFRSKIKLNTD